MNFTGFEMEVTEKAPEGELSLTTFNILNV